MSTVCNEKAITPVAVDSLILPEEIKFKLRTVAASGKESTLIDTCEEFRQAAEIMKGYEVQISSQRRTLLSMPAQPQVGSKVVLDGVEYAIVEGLVIMLDLASNDIKVIKLDLRGCASGLGQATKLATDGNDVYVLFENSNRRLGNTSFGKIVVDGNVRVIQFAIFSDSDDIDFQLLNGALVLTKTHNPWIGDKVEEVVSRSVLTAMRVSYLSHLCKF